jgi:ABC-type antimicrobial peptide transport system permease subunit
VPLRQTESDEHHVVIRTAVSPLTVARAVAAEIASFDPGFSADGITTMDAIVRRTQGPWRFNVLVFGLFGGVALALSAVGLFALVAWDVAQRSREIGLRMALGAARGDVVRLMLWQGAKPSLAGMAAGLAIALAVTRVMSQPVRQHANRSDHLRQRGGAVRRRHRAGELPAGAAGRRDRSAGSAQRGVESPQSGAGYFAFCMFRATTAAVTPFTTAIRIIAPLGLRFQARSAK